MSRGVLIEASIVARLLGIKLLRLRADVVLVPARLEPTAILEVHELSQPVRSHDRDGRLTPIEASRDGTLGDAAAVLQHARKTLRESKRTL
jgi:hypothetical protein